MALPNYRHLGLKFVSIALAALLWLIVSGEQIVERALRIPLELTNLPSQLEVVGDPPTIVDVRIRGSSGTLTRLAPGELVATVDLRTARPGRRLFHLAGNDVRAPFGVDVVQVTPSTVFMTFEPSATKTVPVVPSVEGEPAAGLVVGTVTADPATVEVIGPTSAVAKLTEAITEPVSVNGLSASVNESVTIGVPDPSVRLRSPQNARVRVNVTPAPEEWTIANVPVLVRNAHGPTELAPPDVTVRVRGTRESSTAAVSDFEAWVDVQDLLSGRFDLPVKVVPPARTAVVSVEPAQVAVRIR